MHTYTYKNLPILSRTVFLDQCERKGISLKECPFEWRPDMTQWKGIQHFRPVAIVRRSYGFTTVALYAVIYRNVSTGAMRVKHSWGKVEMLGHWQAKFAVGE